jgi:hypothetical protein
MIAKRHTLSNALRVAAAQYATDAMVQAKEPAGGEGLMSTEGRQRLVDCFNAQAKEAFQLADDIEQANTINLED